MMNVQEVMSKDVVCCGPDSTAEWIATAMWDHDCGCIPVVDEAGRPVGIVTDRDIAIGAALQHRPLWDIKARDITNGRKVICCGAKDEVHAALDAMRRHSVRRLPVVDEAGHLAGVISLGDLVAVAGTGSRARLPLDDTLGFLQSVSSHHMAKSQAPMRVA